jgi:hypothetical protein
MSASGQYQSACVNGGYIYNYQMSLGPITTSNLLFTGNINGVTATELNLLKGATSLETQTVIISVNTAWAGNTVSYTHTTDIIKSTSTSMLTCVGTLSYYINGASPTRVVFTLTDQLNQAYTFNNDGYMNTTSSHLAHGICFQQRLPAGTYKINVSRPSNYTFMTSDGGDYIRCMFQITGN